MWIYADDPLNYAAFEIKSGLSVLEMCHPELKCDLSLKLIY